MTVRMAAFTGWCPVNLEDFVTLKDGRTGPVIGIRTIHQMTLEEQGNGTFFEILIHPKLDWIRIEEVHKTTWIQNGEQKEKIFAWP